MDERVIAVIDGNSLMHRAFHAVMHPMNAPDGRPTNACFGFIAMLIKLIEDFKPEGVIVAFDAGIPASRLDTIEQYKAQRPPTDPDLKTQFPMIEQLLVALNIPVVKVADYEGDDILGTLSNLAEQEGGIKTLLISGDKDALQLASDKTLIVTNRTGMSDVKIYDPAAVYERFGVDPAHVPDYLGLMGDSSDNIPGIPGVGPKTATTLLQDYGDIEGVIAHAGELKGKLAEKVASGAQLALDSRQVATIIRDVPLTIDFSRVAFPSFDSREVSRAFGELGMMSQLRKLLRLAGELTGERAGERTGERAGEAQHEASVIAGSPAPTAAATEPTIANQTGASDSTDSGQRITPRPITLKHVEPDLAALLAPRTSYLKPVDESSVDDSGAEHIPVADPDISTDAERVYARSIATILSGELAELALSQILGTGSLPERELPGRELPGRMLPGRALPGRVLPGRVLSEPEQGKQQLGLYLDDATRNSSAKARPAQQSLVFDREAEPARTLYIATENSTIMVEGHAAATVLKQLLLKRIALVTYDFKELLSLLVPADTSSQALLTTQELLACRAFDLSLASYLLDSDQPIVEPLRFVQRYLPGVALELISQDLSDGGSQTSGKANAPASPNGLTPASQNAAALAAAARAIAPILQSQLAETQALPCFEQIEQPLTPVLMQIERNGVKVDTTILAEQGKQLTKRIDELRAEAFALAGFEFNLDSPKQVGEILFDRLQLPKGKKTKSGYSTDASVLTELKPLSPLPGIILDYRELAKLRSTYLEALPRLVAADGLIHTSFNQTVAATGRLSSSDPNLQNIPVRTDIGRHIRTAFVAAAEALGVRQAVFVSADYSQIELRLLAHLSGDEHLIAAFISGEDFHRATAARVYGVAPAEVSPEMRSRAKAVNFGIVYGQQAFGLAQSLGIGFVEAGEMIKRYFAAYPQVQAYLESLKAQAHAQGWVETIFGRRRQTHEIGSRLPARRSFAERIAMNHPMQGSAADIIKLAMIQISTRLEQEGYRSRMVLQVHDELDFNCDIDELERLTTMVSEIMQNVVALKVPLVVEVASATNWAEAH